MDARRKIRYKSKGKDLKTNSMIRGIPLWRDSDMTQDEGDQSFRSQMWSSSVINLSKRKSEKLQFVDENKKFFDTH